MLKLAKRIIFLRKKRGEVLVMLLELLYFYIKA